MLTKISIATALLSLLNVSNALPSPTPLLQQLSNRSISRASILLDCILWQRRKTAKHSSLRTHKASTGVVAILLATLITACGGGGDSAPTNSKPITTTPPGGVTVPVPQPVIPPLTIVVQAAPTQVITNQTAEIVLAITGDQSTIDVGVEVDKHNNPQVSDRYTYVNSILTYTVTAFSVDTGGTSIDLKVTATDGHGQRAEYVQTITPINPENNAMLKKLSAAAKNIPSIIDLKQETALIARLGEISTLFAGKQPATGASIKDELVSGMRSNDANVARTNLEYWVMDNETFEEDYHKGKLFTSQVNMAMDLLQERLNAYALHSISHINKAVDATQGIVPVMSFLDVNVLEDGTLSQFEGNSTMGEYVNGEWVFFDKYQFLEAIIFPETQPCNAE